MLPPGNWYDFYTGELAGNGEVIQVEGVMDKIPLYVKEGGIIPLMEDANNTRVWKKGVALEVRAYGFEPGATRLYDDDGVTFDYEKGAYCWYMLYTSKRSDGSLSGTIERGVGDFPNPIGDVNWVFMTKQ